MVCMKNNSTLLWSTVRKSNIKNTDCFCWGKKRIEQERKRDGTNLHYENVHGIMKRLPSNEMYHRRRHNLISVVLSTLPTFAQCACPDVGCAHLPRYHIPVPTAYRNDMTTLQSNNLDKKIIFFFYNSPVFCFVVTLNTMMKKIEFRVKFATI